MEREKIWKRVELRIFLLQVLCNKFILAFVIFLYQSLALACSVLVGVLSLSSVSPDLHSDVFHQGGTCTHHGGSGSCGADQKQDDDSDEDASSCAVVLFGQGVEELVYFQISSRSELSTNFEFTPNHSVWTSFKHDSFGARDPPSTA